MKKIDRRQLPSVFPINFTVLGWLLFDRLKIAGWGWGVWWTVCGILWAVLIYDIFSSEYGKADLK